MTDTVVDELHMDRWWLVTVTLCSYEVTAIVSKVVTKRDTIPTITRLHAKYRVVGVALIAALAYHFYTADPYEQKR